MILYENGAIILNILTNNNKTFTEQQSSVMTEDTFLGDSSGILSHNYETRTFSFYQKMVLSQLGYVLILCGVIISINASAFMVIAPRIYDFYFT